MKPCSPIFLVLKLSFPSLIPDASCGGVITGGAVTTGGKGILFSKLDLATKEDIELHKCDTQSECATTAVCTPFDKLPSNIQDRIGGGLKINDDVCVIYDEEPFDIMNTLTKEYAGLPLFVWLIIGLVGITLLPRFIGKGGG